MTEVETATLTEERLKSATANVQKLASFIWGIADDVLRDLYVRGKYRDVILPFTVLRRLDAVLEPTKKKVLDLKKVLDDAGIIDQDQALRQEAGQAFWNTSVFTMRELRGRSSRARLQHDFEAYLDGFSPNVQRIIENFEVRQQIPKLAKADALGALIEKFLDPAINLSPDGLDNHAMGTVFEELVRRFNEANNEEAGEHWTPRDAVRLMTRLVFEPIADQIPDGTYTLYDGAMGTGGMLTVAEETLQSLAKANGRRIVTNLFGQEINAETYAIAVADLLLKGEGANADGLVGGPEYSTLSNDAFAGKRFDFMLSNPPYGKSWATDQQRMGGKKDIIDPRFIVDHAGNPDFSLITRSSDGQMLFLANMVSKMKMNTTRGSRIAEVHNGSSLFTGDAGQGESNIRRYIIENDWLEAVVALPLSMFYNTGIATYVWVLTNQKPARRRGKVQLIDATEWYTPLRKNLGNKSRELGPNDIERIVRAFVEFESSEDDGEHSKVFTNSEFGYYKVQVERPLRLRGVDPSTIHTTAQVNKLIKDGAERDPDAAPVINKLHPKGTQPDHFLGRYQVEFMGSERVVSYAPDAQLRDNEQIPLLEPAGEWRDGIEAFIRREVLPFGPDAWVDESKTRVGYEISFTRHFYQPTPMRTLEEIRADIRAIEAESDNLIAEIGY
ncbi:type I restriction-modification system subunit M [Pseudonocardia alni]|uniref:site-specific DNA-methyltransferase (adenine-specific) n=1 Tax=Pseudonocardia alni TaxID=33907 RepID=A0A852W662_PSEA5|nr:class I SAM-dependent DNA methyltransferase [Pseudonocardia antarctica]NYG00972.1 type I restriction enzyme M protein [Pseudonocardia antarctica]